MGLSVFRCHGNVRAAMPLKPFENVCLAEYQALRAESLSLNSGLSTTLCLSLAAMITSIGSFKLGPPDAYKPQWLILLIDVESVAATVTFLSLAWKYIRAGAYIRMRLEPLLVFEGRRPLMWEESIDSPPARAS